MGLLQPAKPQCKWEVRVGRRPFEEKRIAFQGLLIEWCPSKQIDIEVCLKCMQKVLFAGEGHRLCGAVDGL